MAILQKSKVDTAACIIRVVTKTEGIHRVVISGQGKNRQAIPVRAVTSRDCLRFFAIVSKARREILLATSDKGFFQKKTLVLRSGADLTRGEFATNIKGIDVKEPTDFIAIGKKSFIIIFYNSPISI